MPNLYRGAPKIQNNQPIKRQDREQQSWRLIPRNFLIEIVEETRLMSTLVPNNKVTLGEAITNFIVVERQDLKLPKWVYVIVNEEETGLGEEK